MNQKTLDLIHEKYQESLRKSSNILEIVKNLYNLSKDEEVDSADANEFYSFVMACVHAIVSEKIHLHQQT